MRVRSLVATTVAVLVAVLLWASPETVLATGGESAPARYEPSTTLEELPARYPDREEIAQRAEDSCADLPIPGRSTRDEERCLRYFTEAAQLAAQVAHETGAETAQDLATGICGQPDCSAVIASADLAGLSKYQWPRLRLTASLSVWSALSYVAVSLR